MNRKEIVEESVHIISEYYNNRLQPFFENVSEDVLWVGPRSGQVLRGKEAILKAWGSSPTGLRFSMGNLEARSVAIGHGALEVLLEYRVFTHFPTGEVDEHHQRLHLSWGQELVDGKRTPRMFMIHISNITEFEGSGTASGQGVRVYASSPSDSRRDSVYASSQARITFRTLVGHNGSEAMCYFDAASVLYVESTDRSKHAIVHTLDGDYTSVERLRSFEERYGDALIRAHAGYLVNPRHVKSVRRFALTLSNGTVIPVPERKYTAFRRQLEELTSPNA